MKLILCFSLTLMLAGCDKIQLKADVSPPTVSDGKETNVGRFTLVQLGNFRRDQYLVDTSSGKMWRSVCAHKGKGDAADCQYSIWIEEVEVGINATYDDVDNTLQKLKESSSNKIGRK